MAQEVTADFSRGATDTVWRELDDLRNRHALLSAHAEQAIAGIAEAVRVMDLMGRGGDARVLALYGNNLRAALRQGGEA